MAELKIKAYLKPSCGWSNGVRAILGKYHLNYEDVDVINVEENYNEMVQKSGQPLSPCVEVNGKMLADVSGDEVEEYLLKNNLVKPIDLKLDVKTGAGCDHHLHEETVDLNQVKRSFF